MPRVKQLGSGLPPGLLAVLWMPLSPSSLPAMQVKNRKDVGASLSPGPAPAPDLASAVIMRKMMPVVLATQGCESREGERDQEGPTAC